MIRKVTKSNEAVAHMIVKSCTASNGNYFYELAYILKGADPAQSYLMPVEFSGKEEFKEGDIVKVSFKKAEPVIVESGAYGVELTETTVIGKSAEKKASTTKDIISCADACGCLLVTDSGLFDLSQAGIIKRATGHSITETIHKGIRNLDFTFPIIKSEEKRLIYAVVYEPYDGTNADTHGDYATADEIEKAAHSFFKQAKVNIEHQTAVSMRDVEVVESYVAPENITVNNELVKKGSWVVVMKIHSDDIWKAIKNGELNAYSMEGTGEKSDLQKSDNGKPISKSELLNMNIHTVALCDKGANRKKIFLIKKETITMTKEFVTALVKSMKITKSFALDIAKAAGLDEAAQKEVEAAGVEPPKEEVKKAPPEGATEEQKVQWYIDNDIDIEEVPEELANAYATKLMEMKAKVLEENNA